MTDRKVQRLCDKLYNAINSALDVASPKGRPYSRDPTNKWFTDEIQAFRDRVRKEHKRVQQAPTTANIRKYKAYKKVYKREIRKRKKFEWGRKQRELNNTKDTSKFTKLLLGQNRHIISTFRKPGGDFTLPGEETADFLIKTHFPSAVKKFPITHTHNKI